MKLDLNKRLQNLKTKFKQGSRATVILWRASFALLICLVLYGAGSWLFLPAFLQSTMSQQVENQLGRHLEIGKVYFSPFRLQVTLEAIRLFEADQKTLSQAPALVSTPTPALSAKSAIINLSIASLFRQALILDELQIIEPQINLIRFPVAGKEAASRYNFSDMLDRLNATPKSDSVLRFSLANIQIKNGAVVFQDQMLKNKTKIDQIQIGVPFVSNFPNAIDSFVQPALSARINGSPLTLTGRSKPFSESLDTTLAIDLDHLALPEYLAYSPTALPFVLENGNLSTKLDLTFSRKNNEAEILLSGDVGLDHLVMNDQQGQALAKLDELHVRAKKINLQNIELESIKLRSPELWLAINQDGTLNWAALENAGGVKTASSKKVKQQGVSDVANKSAEKIKPAPTAEQNHVPQITANQILLEGGLLHLNDAHFAKPAQKMELRDIHVQLNQISTKENAPDAQYSIAAQFNENAQQKIELDGVFHIARRQINGKLKLANFQLANIQPYVRPYFSVKTAGNLDVATQFSVNTDGASVQGASLQLSQFKLEGMGQAQNEVAISKLGINSANIDFIKRIVELNDIQTHHLQVNLTRDERGQWGWQQLKSSVQAQTKPGNAEALDERHIKPIQETQSHANWQVLVTGFSGDDIGLHLRDAGVFPAADLKIDGLKIKANQFKSDLSSASKIELDGTLNQRGKFQFAFDLTPQLRSVQVNVNAKALPVAPFSPYLSPLINIALNRGTLDVKGQLRLDHLLNDAQNKAGLQSAFEGNLGFNDFQFAQIEGNENFLEWKSITLDGLSAKWNEKQPLINLKKLSLNDFYTKLILSEKGVLNIKNVALKNSPAPSENPAVKNSNNTAVAVKQSAQNPSTATDAGISGQIKPIIRIGEIAVSGGNINYTDNFVQPHYVADLTEVSGKVGAFASDSDQSADLTLTGRIDHDAPLQISGNLNPLHQPIKLNIKGSANGIELTRLTPYAAKYAGYGIEKGKLSMQVNYRIDGDQLQAQNNLVLDQLTFGKRIDHPDATHLPVQLAVALLKDSRGQIAIDLPVSGSLSDPQFSIGGVLFKVFVNLLTKAVTSPFALLGSLFGGGEELAYIEFAAGSEVLTQESRNKLDSLATALQNRAALKLDITGRIDPNSDVDGLKLAVLDAKVRQLKWRDLGSAQKLTQLEQVSVDEEDRKKYLDAVYRAENFTKPRNVLGFAKTLPVENLRQLILTNTPVTEADLLSLAQRRADAVRHYLQVQKNVGADRLFLIAPKLTGDGITDHGSIRRVDFSLK